MDDEPYGGGAGMVLRVDVVAAALEAVYGGSPEHRVVALTPQGRQLTQEVVEELATEERLTLLSARFEGFDERVVDHLASDAISIGPYVLSGGELPAMVLLDAVARRLPGALREESGTYESFSAELDGGLEYPHYTRPADFRGWNVPDVLLSGDHGRIDAWRREQSQLRSTAVTDHYAVLGVSATPRRRRSRRRTAASRSSGAGSDGFWRELRDAYDVLSDPAERTRYDSSRDGEAALRKQSRNPVDRLYHRTCRTAARVALDWIVTIAGAVAIVLAIKAWVVNPYRIPSSSMEPTLHCARPGLGCEARTSDRVLANRFIYHFRAPHRGDIVVFHTPPLAVRVRRRGHVRQAADRASRRCVDGRSGDGFVYINGKKLDEPYIGRTGRDTARLPGRYYTCPEGQYLMMGDNRASVLRLPRAGAPSRGRT